MVCIITSCSFTIFVLIYPGTKIAMPGGQSEYRMIPQDPLIWTFLMEFSINNLWYVFVGENGHAIKDLIKDTLSRKPKDNTIWRYYFTY